MSQGTFTATHSFHGMLKRAQELSPVLTYVVCLLLHEIDLEEQNDNPFVESRKVDISYSDPLQSYFYAEYAEPFIQQIFSNLTVAIRGIGVTYTHRDRSREYSARYLRAHRQFVRWLQQEPITFHHEEFAVTIRA